MASQSSLFPIPDELVSFVSAGARTHTHAPRARRAELSERPLGSAVCGQGRLVRESLAPSKSSGVLPDNGVTSRGPWVLYTQTMRTAPAMVPGNSEPAHEKPADGPPPGNSAGHSAGNGDSSLAGDSSRSHIFDGGLATASIRGHPTYADIPVQDGHTETDQPILIGIAGAIGIGKTTLAAGLARVFSLLPARLFREQPMSKMLEQFYRDPKAFALDLQVLLINERQTLREEAKKVGPKIAIFDRTPEEDIIFIRLLQERGLLRDESAASLCALIQRWCRDHPFDLVFRLRANPEVCLERQQQRDRRGESVDAGYMRALCNEYGERVSVLYPAGVYCELDANRPPAAVLADAVSVVATRLGLSTEQTAELLARVEAADSDSEESQESAELASSSSTGGKMIFRAVRAVCVVCAVATVGALAAVGAVAVVDRIVARSAGAP